MNGALIFPVPETKTVHGFHPLVTAGGISALKRLVIALQLADVAPIVVLARQRSDVEQHLARMGVICLGPEGPADFNYPLYAEQALAILKIKCRQVLLTSVGFALPDVDTIKALINAEKMPSRPIWNGTAGFPLCASLTDLEAAYYTYDGHIPLPTLEAFLTERIHLTPTDDAGVALDLSTDPDWQKLLHKHKISYIRPVSKFMVAREHVFMGPGTFQLLTAIDQTGSVRSACLLIGISYSKGWRIIHQVEEETGFLLVDRQKGGEKGGFASISPRGKALLEKYNAYVKACSTTVEQLFQEYFADLQEAIKNHDDESSAS